MNTYGLDDGRVGIGNEQSKSKARVRQNQGKSKSKAMAREKPCERKSKVEEGSRAVKTIKHQSHNTRQRLSRVRSKAVDFSKNSSKTQDQNRQQTSTPPRPRQRKRQSPRAPALPSHTRSTRKRSTLLIVDEFLEGVGRYALEVTAFIAVLGAESDDLGCARSDVSADIHHLDATLAGVNVDGGFRLRSGSGSGSVTAIAMEGVMPLRLEAIPELFGDLVDIAVVGRVLVVILCGLQRLQRLGGRWHSDDRVRSLDIPGHVIS